MAEVTTLTKEQSDLDLNRPRGYKKFVHAQLSLACNFSSHNC